MNAFKAIDAHCEAMSVDSMIANLAKCFFQEIVSYRGHEALSTHALVAVCVVYACKQMETSQTAEYVLSFTDIPADRLVCAMKAVGDFLGMSTEEDRIKRERKEWADAEGVRREIHGQFNLKQLDMQGRNTHNDIAPGYLSYWKSMSIWTGVTTTRPIPAEGSHFHEDINQYFNMVTLTSTPGKLLTKY